VWKPTLIRFFPDSCYYLWEYEFTRDAIEVVQNADDFAEGFQSQSLSQD
jgi:hypothetical protein